MKEQERQTSLALWFVILALTCAGALYRDSGLPLWLAAFAGIGIGATIFVGLFVLLQFMAWVGGRMFGEE